MTKINGLEGSSQTSGQFTVISAESNPSERPPACHIGMIVCKNWTIAGDLSGSKSVSSKIFDL